GQDAPGIGDAERGEAGLVDRRIGLAEPAHIAAQRLVALCQGAGANRRPALMDHHQIGVGAYHRHVTRPRRLQQRLVVANRLLQPIAGPVLRMNSAAVMSLTRSMLTPSTMFSS